MNVDRKMCGKFIEKFELNVCNMSMRKNTKENELFFLQELIFHLI